MTARYKVTHISSGKSATFKSRETDDHSIKSIGRAIIKADHDIYDDILFNYSMHEVKKESCVNHSIVVNTDEYSRDMRIEAIEKAIEFEKSHIDNDMQIIKKHIVNTDESTSYHYEFFIFIQDRKIIVNVTKRKN